MGKMKNCKMVKNAWQREKIFPVRDVTQVAATTGTHY